jgi:hypothetical protein
MESFNQEMEISTASTYTFRGVSSELIKRVKLVVLHQQKGKGTCVRPKNGNNDESQSPEIAL